MPFRYKKLALIFSIGAVALSPVAVWAQQSALTNEHIEKIRQNCLSAQVTLQRIQYSDVAIRINRGQAYDGLLTKFVAPFNSRAALNRLSETPRLAEKTDTIEAALSEFKKDYVEYEDMLSATLGIKCQDRPVSFYDSLNSTRELRAKLSADITKVQATLTDYIKLITSIEKSLGGTE